MAQRYQVGRVELRAPALPAHDLCLTVARQGGEVAAIHVGLGHRARQALADPLLLGDVVLPEHGRAPFSRLHPTPKRHSAGARTRRIIRSANTELPREIRFGYFDFAHIVVVEELVLAVVLFDLHARPIAGTYRALIVRAVTPSNALADVETFGLGWSHCVHCQPYSLIVHFKAAMLPNKLTDKARAEPTDQSFFELAASLANRSAFRRSKFLRSAICSFSYSVSGLSDERNMLLASFSRLLMT
jgi:hypothetical protein